MSGRGRVDAASATPQRSEVRIVLIMPDLLETYVALPHSKLLDVIGPRGDWVCPSTALVFQPCHKKEDIIFIAKCRKAKASKYS